MNKELPYDIGLVDPIDLHTAATRAGMVAFDLETTGVNPRKDKIEGISFYVGGDKPLRAWYPFVSNTVDVKKHSCRSCGWYSYKQEDCNIGGLATINPKRRAYKKVLLCPTCSNKIKTGKDSLREAMDESTVLESLRPLFSDPDLIICAHNIKFDYAFLLNNTAVNKPIEIKGKKADSMIAHFIENETHTKYGLKQSVERIFNVKMTSYDQASENGTFGFAQKKPLGIYAMDDTEWCYKLLQHSLDSMALQDSSGRLEKIFWDMEMKITDIVIEMETTGVMIDWEWLLEVSADLEKKKEVSEKKISKLAGRPININSTKQVSDFMFKPPAAGGLGLPTDGLEMGKSGQWPTGNKIISHFARSEKAVKEIANYRSYDTIKSGFSDKLAKLAQTDGRVYSRFNQTGTVIGRFSCVAEDTLIETSDGRVRISEIDLNNKYYAITHLGNNKEIVDLIYKGEDYMYEVELENGSKIKCTKDHRFYTSEGWKALRDLDIGEAVNSYSSVHIFKESSKERSKESTDRGVVCNDICSLGIDTDGGDEALWDILSSSDYVPVYLRK